jgi:uncharacterized membrane protein
MQGPLRKLFHAILFEVIAIVIVTAGMRLLSDHNTAQAGGLAVSTALMALSWNMVFNTLFEAWERRQPSRARTWRRRLAHACLFEGGLVLMTVPVIAWWLSTGWWPALITDLGLVAFFLVYGLAYNYLFDQLFGLPGRAAERSR